MKTLLRIAVLSSVCLWGSAHAAINYFLDVDGIDGESASKGHEKWIEVGSFAWGVTNAGSSGGGGGGSGKAAFMPFSWTQRLDRSAVPIFLAVAGGKHIPTVTFDAQKPGDRAYTFFQMVFENARFTSLTLGGGSSSVDVAGALVYDKITMTYWAQKNDGSRGDPITGGWDLKAGAPTFSGDANVLMGLFLAQPTSFDARGLQPVPEPQTWALMGLGVLALVALRRRETRA